jgi:hypothetical protein
LSAAARIADGDEGNAVDGDDVDVSDVGDVDAVGNGGGGVVAGNCGGSSRGVIMARLLTSSALVSHTAASSTTGGGGGGDDGGGGGASSTSGVRGSSLDVSDVGVGVCVSTPAAVADIDVVPSPARTPTSSPAASTLVCSLVVIGTGSVYDMPARSRVRALTCSETPHNARSL